MKFVRQFPKTSGDWLYQDQEDGTRLFVDDYVILSEDAEPWSECTDEEKTAWEEAHKPEPEVTEAEVVE